MPVSDLLAHGLQHQACLLMIPETRPNHNPPRAGLPMDPNITPPPTDLSTGHQVLRSADLAPRLPASEPQQKAGTHTSPAPAQGPQQPGHPDLWTS